MRFAIVSTHDIHGGGIRFDCSKDDCTSFLSWLHHLDGIHFNYNELRAQGDEVLKEFDLVMMSGHPSFIVDIIRIGNFLKGSRTVSMFYPEGSTQLYDNSIRGFHPEYYEAWRACDVLSMAEEDKRSYYEAFVTLRTIVRFIHVPTSPGMADGLFFLERHMKANRAVVYGDNNPNHPLIATACARDVGLEITAVECGDAEIERAIGPDVRVRRLPKLSQNAFLLELSRSVLHFYPTEWIGTARQVISCAAVGTPCIGSNMSHTQRRLFPDLSFGAYDVHMMKWAAKKLLEDKFYYSYIANKAKEALDFYSLPAAKKRMTEAYHDAVKNRLQTVYA